MTTRNIVWPARPEADPNGIQRLARVLHWCFVAGAVVCLAMIVTNPLGTASLLGASLALALCGRALRYIMAGE